MHKRRIEVIGNAFVVALCIMGAISVLMEMLEIDEEAIIGAVFIIDIVLVVTAGIFFLYFKLPGRKA